MIDQIKPNVYRIKVPLPGSPLKALNSYLIRGQGRSLIVDTGWNHEECKRAMSSALDELGVDLAETDFFITHAHADHLGLVSDLATDSSVVYYSRAEAVVPITAYSRPEHWEKRADLARTHGFPGDAVDRVLKGHPGRRYSPRRSVELCLVKEGDALGVGDYLFRCVETPGHTRGHMCLYEPSRKILICGDHILIDITPNITSWAEGENRLDEYLMSLEKVYSLDVELVLPGHRGAFEDHKQRILELQRHHQARLNEIVSILEKGKQNAFQVASQMTWDVDYESWEVFPISQKWFAFGEAMAHLRYLEEGERIGREIRGQQVLFRLR